MSGLCYSPIKVLDVSRDAKRGFEFGQPLIPTTAVGSSSGLQHAACRLLAKNQLRWVASARPF